MYKKYNFILFSANLLNWEDLPLTNHNHYSGDVLTFSGRFTAIAGDSTTKVEVYQSGKWDENVIPRLGHTSSLLIRFSDFTSLAIGKKLYVFGMNKLL